MDNPNPNTVHRAIRLAEINLSPKGSPEWERALAELGGSDDKRQALLAERDDKQAALAQIIDQFNLQTHADLLAEVLLLAVEALWHTRFSAQRPFTDRELETQATNIRNSLVVMEARVAKCPVHVTPSPTTIYQMYGNDALPLPARRLCNGLRAELLRVEQERAQGRTSHRRRNDLRAAAEPLRTFWVKVARGRPTISSKGISSEGMWLSRTGRFLYACLALIDPTVTERLIADLDK